MRKLITTLAALVLLLVASCSRSSICQQCGETNCFYDAVEKRLEGQEYTDSTMQIAVKAELESRQSDLDPVTTTKSIMNADTYATEQILNF